MTIHKALYNICARICLVSDLINLRRSLLIGTQIPNLPKKENGMISKMV